MAISMLAVVGCVQQAKVDLAVPGGQVRPISGSVLPATLLGLRVSQEDVSQSIERVSRTYLRELSLYSLRRDKLLEATLEVGAFDHGAMVSIDDMVVASVSGGSLPHRARLGATQVWFVRAIQQRLALWFTRDRFYVMSIRDDFRLPITLVRRTLEQVQTT